jgi:hypothetical protein
MSAPSSSQPQPDDWDAVDDVQDVVPDYHPSSPSPSARTVAAKIEYEMAARQKLEQKQFPHRVVATNGSSSDDSSDETGAVTVPTSNIKNMQRGGTSGGKNNDDENIIVEEPPPAVVIVQEEEEPTTTNIELQEEQEEEEVLLNDEPIYNTATEAPPLVPPVVVRTTKLLQVETVRAGEDEQEEQEEYISPLAANTKETIEQHQSNYYFSAASQQPSSSSSRFFHFSGGNAGYPPFSSSSALTVATTSKEPSPVDSRFGSALSSSSFPLPSPMMGVTRSLQFSPLALPPPNSDGFAQVLKERTRQRRAQEDAAVSSLRAQVQRLEHALAMESKRRVSSIRSLHEQSMLAAQELQEKLKKQMADEIQLVNDRLLRMEERMTNLESRYELDISTLRRELVTDNTALQSQLQSLQTQFANEEHQRKVRHQQQLELIQSVADEYQEKWDTERHDRLSSVQALESTISHVHANRAHDVATFEGQLTHELQALGMALQNETNERQWRDQEIFHVLEQYVQQLEESLEAAVTRGSVF